MRRIFLIAVLLVFTVGAFPYSQPASAGSPKIPRGFDFSTEYTVDGCTYFLMVRLYEYSKGVGTTIIDLDSTCLPGPLEYYENVDRNEFNISGSLKSAVLKATIHDESTGNLVVTANVKLRATGNKPSDYFTPALVTGTVVIHELNLTFTFDQDQSGGIWYGT